LLLALLSLLLASPSVDGIAAVAWTPVVATVSAVFGIPSLAGVPAAVSLQLLMSLTVRKMDPIFRCIQRRLQMQLSGLQVSAPAVPQIERKVLQNM